MSASRALPHQLFSREQVRPLAFCLQLPEFGDGPVIRPLADGLLADAKPVGDLLVGLEAEAIAQSVLVDGVHWDGTKAHFRTGGQPVFSKAALALSWMNAGTLGSRLKHAMQAAKLTPAGLARKSASTEMTISNWLNDTVHADHVKASQLFRIADAVGMNARELLQGHSAATRVAEAKAEYHSHAVKPDVLTLALQLVGETLAERGATLPPPKHAEAVQLAYDLLEEGLPQAKVLRFVLAAVA